MSENYDVTGVFYVEQGYSFRSCINIRKRASGLGKYLAGFDKRARRASPDLMAVMMNPGSSAPIDGDDDGRAEVPAQPDQTQRQIMKVMAACKFKYVRILNLSDIRNPDSTDFVSQLKSFEHRGIHHSIFGPQREEDFNRLYVHSVPVILAWGADNRLRPLARLAMSRMRNVVQVGHKKPGDDWVYYHANQRGKKPGIWVDKVVRQLSAAR